MLIVEGLSKAVQAGHLAECEKSIEKTSMNLSMILILIYFNVFGAMYSLRGEVYGIFGSLLLQFAEHPFRPRPARAAATQL